MLAQGIVKELKKRGVDLLGGTGPNKQHVALISEWDNFYGRNFPKTMNRAILNPILKSKKRLLLAPEIHKFSYTRGVDGQTAAAAEGKKDGKSDP